jgi:hypothetical protein
VIARLDGGRAVNGEVQHGEARCSHAYVVVELESSRLVALPASKRVGSVFIGGDGAHIKGFSVMPWSVNPPHISRNRRALVNISLLENVRRPMFA